jgi:methanogenic corrinoid protein MtbC1
MHALLSSGSIDSSLTQEAVRGMPLFALAASCKAEELAVITKGEIEAFAVECLQDRKLIAARIQSWLVRGVDIETIYLQAVAMACQIFGEWWRDDVVDFASVTLATCRLQQCLFEMSPRFLGHAGSTSNGYSALFLLPTATQHSIGSFIVGEIFRKNGWKLAQLSYGKDAVVKKMVGSEWFDLVGYSVSCDHSVELAKSLIPKIRRCSVNPNIQIMVGGPMLMFRPSLAQEVGADFSGVDARTSERYALMMVREVGLSSRRQMRRLVPHVSFRPKLHGSGFCGA